jgi:hypothetical protein
MTSNEQRMNEPLTMSLIAHYSSLTCRADKGTDFFEQIFEKEGFFQHVTALVAQLCFFFADTLLVR